jgi:hypothetical protein
MSTEPPEEAPLDMRAILARIDRDLAESDELRAETRKFVAEANKMTWDRWLAPIVVIVGGIGGGIALANFLIQHGR